MQIHQLQRKTKLKKRKRIGRGGKRGTYSGRGVKGQRSRAGRHLQPLVRILIKRYHKLRGYKFNPVREKFIALKLSLINKHFSDGDKITQQVLRDKKLINQNEKAKIVGDSREIEFNKKLHIIDVPVSSKVKELIKSKGGTVEN